jgi:hypothetical protein
LARHRLFQTLTLALASSLALVACNPAKPANSEARKVADAFMTALSQGDTEQAQQLTIDQAESQAAVAYMTQTVKKRLGEKEDRAFDFRYVSESKPQNPKDPARVVYTQRINNEVAQDNMVVEVSLDPATRSWKVTDLILR